MASPAAYNEINLIEAKPTTKWENDPARVHPEIKKYTTVAGAGKIFYYVDTCQFCANYSCYRAACMVRETRSPDEKVKSANNPLPVAGNWKCKFWEPRTKEKCSSQKRTSKQRCTECRKKPKSQT